MKDVDKMAQELKEFIDGVTLQMSFDVQVPKKLLAVHYPTKKNLAAAWREERRRRRRKEKARRMALKAKEAQESLPKRSYFPKTS